jgi:hypothetical protein
MIEDPAIRDIQLPPIRHATDRRKLREAEKKVRGLLSPDRRRQALGLSSRSARRSLRARPLGSGSPAVYMPRDAYLSIVQDALERRMEFKRQQKAKDATLDQPSAPQAADGTSVELGDQLFDEFGPDDWGWIKTAVEATLTTLDGGPHRFGTHPAEVPLASRARVVLLADWGTGTPRARALAERARKYLEEVPGMERHVIHLGDVYYCGMDDEYRTRFLNDWPATTAEDIMSWNLNGNHDMYSGGNGYFEVISKEPFARQAGTSCFRLFNEHWQFIGLDTAYLDNDLYPQQLPWIKTWVLENAGTSAEAAARKTVLLSHHQLGSALAQPSVGPGIREKTAELREDARVHAWFWGHEHRAFVYEPYLGVACPVCLGNGGVPELLSRRLTLQSAFAWLTGIVVKLMASLRRSVAAPVIQYAPPRPDIDEDGLKWEKLGFVVLDIDGAQGTGIYVDEDGMETPITAFGR